MLIDETRKARIAGLRYDHWIALKTVEAMRADLAAAEKELKNIEEALIIASSRSRCGPVVVA